MVTSGSAGRSPANVPENPGLYWVFWLCGIAIIVTLLIVAFAIWSVTLFDKFDDIRFDGGPTVLLGLAAYIALSLKTVAANEVAGAYCYGTALVRLKSGLHFLPFGLMQLATASRTVQEFQCPGEPETVFKGDDRLPLPTTGMVRPIRAVTRAPKEDEKDVLDTRMTLDLNFVVQYAVIDIFDYVANFGSEEEVQKQLRDVGEITLAEEVTQHTPNTFIKMLKDTNAKLATATSDRFEHSGVKIVSIRLVSPDISHAVSSALADVPVARAKAQQTVITADAERTKRLREGEGAAGAELQMLSARAEGQKKMIDALGVSGETIVAAEAVRGLSDKTDVIVVGAEGGMRDVMGLVKGAQSALATKSVKEGVKS